MPSPFESLHGQVQECRQTQEVLRQRRAALHQQVQLEVARTVTRYLELFPDEDSGPLADSTPRVPDKADVLDDWYLEGDRWVFEFSYGFRGERCHYEIQLPVRYLAADAELQLEKDVQSARLQAEKRAANARALQEQRDRKLYAALRSRFESSGEPK